MHNVALFIFYLGSSAENDKWFSFNSSATFDDAAILPLRVGGVEPPNFPQTRGALQALTTDESIQLMDFYNLPNVAGRNEHQRQLQRLAALKAYLGIR